MDRQKTVVLLPGGIMEEHGPYLPAYADGFTSAFLAGELAKAIVARPGWKVVVFPQIPLGDSGANEIGKKYVFPGSYTVRMSTLRAVYMDIASQFGEQGFRWIFIVHTHGDPAHNRALDQASDYFHDVYGGAMVSLVGVKPIMECCEGFDTRLSPTELKEDGFTVHAGVDETSYMLFLRPGLVSSSYVNAPSWTGENFPDLYKMAAKPDWPGYFGAPRLASASLGARWLTELSRRTNDTALRILDGLDWRSIPRFADSMDPRDAEGEMAILEHESVVGQKQTDWMKKKKIAQ